MNWRQWAEDAELQFNPQANPDVDFRATFALRDRLSMDARKRLTCRLDVRYGVGERQLLDIFPAAGWSKGPIHVHIHGGYFRMGDKSSVSLIADPFVAAGISCVMPTYDLCPKVSLETIVAQVLDAIAWVYTNAETIGDPNRIHVSGSSAGALLCALALGYDWAQRGLPRDLIKGATLLTGIYDLEPLLKISINHLVGLTPERVRALSPRYHPPLHPVSVLLEVGGKEPPGWQAQSTEFAEICRSAGCEVELFVLPDETHFSVGPTLASDPRHPLTRKMIETMTNASSRSRPS